MGSSSGRNSVVECQLPKLDVGGSNPLARFFFSPCWLLSASAYNCYSLDCKGRWKKGILDTSAKSSERPLKYTVPA